MVFVTKYHKGYSRSGDVRIIHRYLPREIGTLLLYYLWLVLPFQERLELEVYSPARLHSHLWCPDPDGRRWKSERMRHLLQSESQRGLGYPLNISSYRHLAIAISRRYFQGPLSFAFNHTDDDDEEDDGELHHIMDAQAAHSSHVAGQVYARGTTELAGSLTHLRQRFHSASQMWHRFLQFESSYLSVHHGKRYRDPFEDEYERLHLARWKRIRDLDLDATLIKMLGEGSQFRGIQRAAIEAVVRGDNPILTVMATGAGKSMVFLLPAWGAMGGTTVVLVPLIALRQDLRRRCQALGISCLEWTSRRSNQAVNSENVKIVLVMIESFVETEFQSFIQRLHYSQQLDRIVLDECHELLLNHDTFRPAFQHLHVLAQMETQMIFLSATLPPSQEKIFCDRLGIQLKGLHIFRAPTTRTNIQYQIQRVNSSHPQDLSCIIKIIRDQMLQSTAGRTLVFCRSIAQGKILSKGLGCKLYHAGAAMKELILDQFISSLHRILVVTSALSLGFDVPDIYSVFHVDRPFSLIEYVQQSGRAGRDGQLSKAHIFLLNSTPFSSKPGAGMSDQSALDEFLRDEGQAIVCRRITLDGYLDGRVDRKGCQKDDEELCDVCRKHQDQGRRLIPYEMTKNRDERSTTISPAQERRFKIPNRPPPERDDEETEEFQRQRALQVSFRQQMVDRIQQERDEFDGVTQQLQFWQQHCAICLVVGRSAKGHRWPRCLLMEGHEQREMAQQLHEIRTQIQFAKNTGCFQCGLHHEICGSWDQSKNGGLQRIRSKDCEFRGILAETMVALQRQENVVERVKLHERVKEKGLDPTQLSQLIQYYGQAARWAGTRVNCLMQEFQRLDTVFRRWYAPVVNTGD
jgi:superfamily II DNA helicase RecQ